MNRARLILAPGGATEAERHELIDRAGSMGFRRFAVPRDTLASVPAGAEAIGFDGDELRLTTDPASPSIRIHSIANAEELARLLDAGPEAGTPIAVRWTRDRVIPLENLLANSARRRSVWVVAGAPHEVPAALGALERGADAVLVPISGTTDLQRLEQYAVEVSEAPGPLTSATLQRVEPVGLGDRVLVDTTSMLEPDEGLLVGSAAAFQFLVASEAEGSVHTRPRPFRVNAGAAHLYTPLANRETRYLSELTPGDALPVVRADGTARSVRVGRLKIERRPLVLIEARVDGRARTVFLQEAETVRLVGPAGRIPVTELRPGNEVLGVRMAEARHVGVVVEERIDER
ncbi:MAG TPA: 3-dehydroquinate synthase II [Thermoplasmata archaeon]|nr:3-dehydroquinate synthase II [Thermoplasmata archaeon]